MTLTEIQHDLLDSALNIGPRANPNQLLETLIVTRGAKEVEESRVWDESISQGLLEQSEGMWKTTKAIDPKLLSEVEASLVNKAVSRDMMKEKVNELIGSDEVVLGRSIDLVGQVVSWEDRDAITFADGAWNGNVGRLCDTLVKERIMFRFSTSSKRRSYRSYVVRRWPFRFLTDFRDIVWNKVDYRGLDETHWMIIFLALAGPSSTISHDLLLRNIRLTPGELREEVSFLRAKRFLDESPGVVSIPFSMRVLLGQLIKQEFYPKYKARVISFGKKRMQKSTNAIWQFATVKRTLDLPGGSVINEPVARKRYSKSEIGEISGYLDEMSTTGLILNKGGDIEIFSEPVEELDRWLRSSINQSLTIIPENDRFYAAAFFKDLFSKCEEYVKIQDPYIGETTFDLLQYVPPGMRLTIATGLALGDGEDYAAVISDIERFRLERKGSFNINFIGNKKNLTPIFHERFIITRNRCWQVGNSLLNMGGAKETTVTEHSISYKDEIVEPAFDRWLTIKLRELEEKDRTRVEFVRWVEDYGKPHSNPSGTQVQVEDPGPAGDL